MRNVFLGIYRTKIVHFKHSFFFYLNKVCKKKKMVVPRTAGYKIPISRRAFV